MYSSCSPPLGMFWGTKLLLVSMDWLSWPSCSSGGMYAGGGVSAEKSREQLERMRPVVAAGKWFTHRHTHFQDWNNHHRICTPEMVSDFTYPLLAKPHGKPTIPDRDAIWAFQPCIEGHRETSTYLGGIEKIRRRFLLLRLQPGLFSPISSA